MPEIVMQDPGSTEVQSPLISGLTVALNKISKALNLTASDLSDEALKAVSIDTQPQNKNRIYEVGLDKKLWLTLPEPVIKKNGVPLQRTTTPYTIDYIGGSITFNKSLTDDDQLTVTCKHIAGDSTTIATITETLNTVSLKSDRYKGYFDTESTLSSAHPIGKKGDFAIIEKPKLSVFAWDDTKKSWQSTQILDELKKYYTKEETDKKLSEKENLVSGNGKTKDYYAGNKTWQDLESAVRGTPLSGFGSVSGTISQSDSLLTALGKLQWMLDNKESWLKGSGEPTISTKGKVGQRYVNTSNGDWYTCKAASGSTYTWSKGQDNIEEKIKSIYEKKENVKVFSATFRLDGWQVSGNEWTQTATCSGMKSAYDTEPPWFNKTGNETTDAELQDGLHKICAGSLETLEGAIKATVPNKPTCDLTVFVRRASAE